jgi:adenosylcobyric acid synthase
MLAHEIEDDIEGEVGVMPGLGLLPTRVQFGAEKVLARPTGSWRGHAVDGAYEIHHGRATRGGLRRPAGREAVEPFLDGWVAGSVWGTMWHGAFESDDFRRAWLTQVAEQAGSEWRPLAGAPGFAERREHMLDTLADAMEQHVDVEALLQLTRAGKEFAS